MELPTSTHTVPETYHKSRLDLFLSETLDTSRSKVHKLLKNGQVYVNDIPAKKAGQTVHTGHTVEIREKKVENKSTNQQIDKPTPTNVEVVHESDTFLIVNKPAGLLVHPTEAEEPVTLASWLLKRYPDVEGVGESVVRPGIVHRLDKCASGLLVVARTQEMFEHLKGQFKNRTVEKEYTVLVYGTIAKDHSIIDFDIDRGVDGRMVARPKTDMLKLKNVNKDLGGKEAKTEFWTEREFVRFSLLKVRIHTGRMHQIRVHMLAYGHPVVGDTLYENKRLIKKSDTALGRLFLHASTLSFTDLQDIEQSFSIDLPETLQNHLQELT